MKTDVEELLRDGMERFTEGVRAPAGLAATAGRRHRRRVTVRISAACGGVAAVAAAAALVISLPAGDAPASTGTSGTQARTVAYVVTRVKQALAGERQVFYGQSTSTHGPSITWAYGPWSRWEELSGTSCGHVLRNGNCTNQGGSERVTDQGTARVHGKLTQAHVTYYNRQYSLLPDLGGIPASACSTAARLAMGGPPVAAKHWSSFINASLACGAASVTGHVWINGQETTKITGVPVTVRLQRGYAKAVGESGPGSSGPCT